MVLFGTIAAVILSIILVMFFGPYGIMVFLAIFFGMVLSTYMRTKEIQNDIQRIKEKLGIEDTLGLADTNDFQMSDEEIEQELEKEMESDELREINEQIEKELEEYADSVDKDTKNK